VCLDLFYKDLYHLVIAVGVPVEEERDYEEDDNPECEQKATFTLEYLPPRILVSPLDCKSNRILITFNPINSPVLVVNLLLKAWRHIVPGGQVVAANRKEAPAHQQKNPKNSQDTSHNNMYPANHKTHGRVKRPDHGGTEAMTRTYIETVLTKQELAREDARARRVGQAVQCMKRFFDGKPYYKPYPDPKDESKLCHNIPPEVLICPTNIDIILETPDFNEAMQIVHEEVARHKASGQRFSYSGFLDDQKEIELYNRLVREFSKLEIPYDFQGGMVLLYLWLCEGVEFK